MAAVGVLLVLFLVLRTARIAGLDGGQVWNLCILSLFAALVTQRLLLVAVNLGDLRRHPQWMLALAMIHHPFADCGRRDGWRGDRALVCAQEAADARRYGRCAGRAHGPGIGLRADRRALAGSGFGSETAARWAVTYTDPLAARWSGTPLGIPLHPVQAYAALALLALSILLLLWLPYRRQTGDVAGIWLLEPVWPCTSRSCGATPRATERYWAARSTVRRSRQF